MHRPLLLLLLGAACAASFSACSDSGDSGRVRIAFVSNCVDPFWDVAAAGARAAEKEFDVDVDIVFPSPGTVEVQRQKVEDLRARGIDGLAISPRDAENMTPFLNELAQEIKLITHDSDAPKSDRLCFVGVDNYEAGRACGELLASALPDGGQVAIFVGPLEQDNARKRRQGVIDALVGREPDATRFDSPDASPAGNGFTIVATRSDDTNAVTAKANAEDILVKYPELDAMVGLFAYNAPACVEALKGADRLSDVIVVSFDEDRATLDGIEAGHVVGTVSQNPYAYGYESVRILASVIAGDDSALPEGGVLSTPPTVVTTENLAEFRAQLDAALGEGE